MAEIINLLDYMAPTRATDKPLSDGPIVKIGIRVGKENFSLTLETDIWAAFQNIASREKSRVEDVCSVILKIKPHAMSLSSAIRSFVVDYYRTAATEEGHRQAGHGNNPSECPKRLH